MTQALGKNQQGGNDIADPWMQTDQPLAPAVPLSSSAFVGKALPSVRFLLQEKGNQQEGMRGDELLEARGWLSGLCYVFCVSQVSGTTGTGSVVCVPNVQHRA